MVGPIYNMPLVQADPTCLLRDGWSAFWPEFARRIRAAIGPVECRHARNKREGDISKPWHYSVAKYVNREAQLATSQDLPRDDADLERPEAMEEKSPRPKQVRRRSAQHLFRDQCFKRDQGVQLGFKKLSAPLSYASNC